MITSPALKRKNRKMSIIDIEAKRAILQDSLKENGMILKISSMLCSWNTMKLSSCQNKRESTFISYLDITKFSKSFHSFWKLEILHSVGAISKSLWIDIKLWRRYLNSIEINLEFVNMIEDINRLSNSWKKTHKL